MIGIVSDVTKSVECSGISKLIKNLSKWPLVFGLKTCLHAVFRRDAVLVFEYDRGLPVHRIITVWYSIPQRLVFPATCVFPDAARQQDAARQSVAACPYQSLYPTDPHNSKYHHMTKNQTMVLKTHIDVADLT